MTVSERERGMPPPFRVQLTAGCRSLRTASHDMLSRRRLLGLLAAPAAVRFGSAMTTERIRVPDPLPSDDLIGHVTW